MNKKSPSLPRRQEIYDALKQNSESMHFGDLAELFGIDDARVEKAFSNRLNAMLKSGELIYEDDHYRIDKNRTVYSIETHVLAKSGRLVVQSVNDEQLLLPPYISKHLFVNDKVCLRLIANNDSSSPRIISAEVLERKKCLIGKFDESGCCVTPLDSSAIKNVSLGGEVGMPICDGDIVLVRLLPPAFLGEPLAGDAVEVCNYANETDLEIDKVIHQFDLPCRWDEAVMSEAKSVAKSVQINGENGRRDLRDKLFVTIDGEDAKDFDDAILVDEVDGYIHLSVAIADVASYVAQGSAIDRVAYERGNSVYFPTRVVPMLPPALCDDLCSLRPNEDRLALICTMRLAQDGNIEDYQFYPAVICSKARLTYTQVSQFLKKKGSLSGVTNGVATMLRLAHRTWRVLQRAQAARNALEINIPDAKIIFGENKRPVSLMPFERNDAHRLIEEFMICANISAARFLADHNAPHLRRVHQGLKTDSVEKLKNTLAGMGFTLRNNTAADLNDLLQKAQGHPQEELIHRAILQSLTRAIYAPLDTGHFGLALSHYTHFTSPIRRYSDLLTHRAIYAMLGFPSGATVPEEQLSAIGTHCSETEAAADGATRDIDRYLKCQLLEGSVGNQFNATINAVTDFGLFMELEGTYTDGLIHISQIGDDYYRFDPDEQTLQSDSGTEVYRFGMSMKVTIVRVDPVKREIDLVPAGNIARRRRASRRGR